MYRLKEGGRAAVILPDGFLFGTDNAKVAIKKSCSQNVMYILSFVCRTKRFCALYIHHDQYSVL
ncbi:MAG: N-6 DNA methylase [Roseburia intestinalis]